MPNQEQLLREKYYLDHFQYLIDFIKAYYLNLLNLSELKFVNAIENLSLNAQCLLARLYNRQGMIFAVSKLKYPEINDMAECLLELERQGLIQYLKKPGDIDLSYLLKFKNCDELLALLKHFQVKLKNNHMNKTQLIEVVVRSHIDDEDIMSYLVSNDPAIILPFKEEYLTLRFLLFGNLKQNMTQFVIKELKGFEPLIFNKSHFCALFTSRQEIDEGFAIQKAYQHINIKNKEPMEVFVEFNQWRQQNSITTEFAKLTYGKLAIRLASYFEKLKLYQQAIAIYETTSLPPANKKRIKLYAKINRLDEAIQLSQTIIKESQHAEEIIFAKDFLAKIQQRNTLKATSLHLKQAEKLQLVLNSDVKPEDAVIAHLNSLDYQAYFAENYLWKGLFGLLFWDILFDKHAPYFHHPFQFLPTDLKQGKILHTRNLAIKQRLQILGEKTACVDIIRNHYNQYDQTPNGIVSWHPDLLFLIEKNINFLDRHQLETILVEMASDWRNNSIGFPDIMCWRNNEYCFIEVKSTFDKLSPYQLRWLTLFQKIGVNAKILHLI